MLHIYPKGETSCLYMKRHKRRCMLLSFLWASAPVLLFSQSTRLRCEHPDTHRLRRCRFCARIIDRDQVDLPSCFRVSTSPLDPLRPFLRLGARSLSRPPAPTPSLSLLQGPLRYRSSFDPLLAMVSFCCAPAPEQDADGLPVDVQLAKHSRAIDREIKEDEKRLEKEVKMLLLGTMEKTKIHSPAQFAYLASVLACFGFIYLN
jgi:hypothetical protein